MKLKIDFINGIKTYVFYVSYSEVFQNIYKKLMIFTFFFFIQINFSFLINIILISEFILLANKKIKKLIWKVLYYFYFYKI